MDDNKYSVGPLLGLTLGAILVFILLTKKPHSISAQPLQQPIQPIQPYDLQYSWPMDIPRVDDIKYSGQQINKELLADDIYTYKNLLQSPVQIIQIDPQLTQMLSQLGNAISQLEQAVSKLQNTISLVQQNTYQQSPQSQHTVLQQQTIPQTPVIVQSIQPVNISEQHQHIQDIHTKRNKEQQLKTTVEGNNMFSSNTIYKNDEKWEIKRGQDGRIKSLNIIRDVKKNS